MTQIITPGSLIRPKLNCHATVWREYVVRRGLDGLDHAHMKHEVRPFLTTLALVVAVPLPRDPRAKGTGVIALFIPGRNAFVYAWDTSLFLLEAG